MSANIKWTGRRAQVLSSVVENFQFENVSPLCAVDSQGNAWVPIITVSGNVMTLHLYRGDKTNLLSTSGWESEWHIDWEGTDPYAEWPLSAVGMLGWNTPYMLIDDEDNVFLWWYRDLWSPESPTTENACQAVQGTIDAETGEVTMGTPVDLGVPYIEGFGPQNSPWYGGLEIDPDGYLWIIGNPVDFVDNPNIGGVYGLRYGNDLDVGFYYYALSNVSNDSEMGRGIHWNGVWTKEHGDPPGSPVLDSLGHSGSFPGGSEWQFKATIYMDGDDGGETAGSGALEVDIPSGGNDWSITLSVPVPPEYCTGRRYYCRQGSSGTFYRVAEVANTEPTTVTILAPPSGSEAVIPDPGTLGMRRVHMTVWQGPPGTISRKVYRTQANGSVFGYVATIENNNNAEPWTDTTDDNIGDPPPHTEDEGSYCCLFVGRSDSPLSLDSVTWEKVEGWDQSGWLGNQCAIVPLGDDRAVAIYSNETGKQLVAKVRSSNGTWGQRNILVDLQSGGFTLGSALLVEGQPRIVYAAGTTQSAQWYYAELEINGSVVSMSPVEIPQTISAWGLARLTSLVDSGMLATQIDDKLETENLHLAKVKDDEVELDDCEVELEDGIGDWVAPRWVKGDDLWAVSLDDIDADHANLKVVQWTATVSDPPCDECQESDAPPCGPGDSDSEGVAGNAGGPSGGVPIPDISGYRGDAAVVRLMGGTVQPSGQHESGRCDRYYFDGRVWTPIAGRRSTLVQNEDDTWTETTPYGVRYEFPATSGAYPRAVHLSQQVDANGNRVTLSYDSGNLQSVLDAFRQRLTFTYDGSNRVSAVQDIAGISTTFSYDADSNLQSVLHPDGARVTYVYDSNHDLVAAQDPLQHTTSFAYDGYRRLTHVTDPTNRVVRTITYSTFTSRTVIVDGRGNVWTNSYGGGMPLQRQDPLGGVRANEWTQEMDATAFVDARGGRWSYSYDEQHRMTGMISPLLCLHSYAYDSNNMPTVYVNPLGFRTTYGYDGNRNRTLEVHADSGRVSYVYDSQGQLTALQDPRGYFTTHSYDARGNRITTTTPDSAVTTFSYDLANRLVATTNPLGKTWTTIYDVMGRTIATENPLNERTSYLYDLMGRQIAVIDPLGARTTTQYNALGQAEATVDALGSRTSYSYDANGNRTAVTDPLGAITTYIYDARDRLIGQLDPLGRTTSYVYDADGNQIAAVDGLSRRSTTSYDAVSRPTGTVDAIGSITTTLYFETGVVKAVIDPLGRRTSYSYDGMGRQKEIIDPLNNRTTFVYDLSGNQIERQDANRYRWTSVYDSLGHLAAQVDPLNNRTTFSYNAAGNQVERQDANQNRWTSVYDEAGRMIAQVDPQNNRTTHSYDAAGRRTEEINALGQRTSYRYDAAGNLLSFIVTHN